MSKPAPKRKPRKTASKPRTRAKRAPAERVIETRDLTKTFGPVRAVDGLNLDMKRGEIYGILGPNGAGKSTTMRMLLDFIKPTSGSYTLLGGTGADPAIRARIGYLPGELRYDLKYTGRDIVNFYGGLRGGVDEKWVELLCARFSLDPSRPIGQLSSGNRRKVAILQAFMHRPELYMLDEPTQGLDPLLQQEFLALVKEEVLRGASVFLSSHVLPEVESLADRVGILRRGKLVTITAVHELQRRARQRIELHVSGEASVRPFEQLPSVVDVSRAGNIISVVVEGPVDAVVKQAAKLNVRRIITRETDLEDVFLDLYREEEQ